MELLQNWNVEGARRKLKPGVLEIAGRYILKSGADGAALCRSAALLRRLRSLGVPAAEVVPARDGRDCVEADGRTYLMTAKLPGASLTGRLSPGAVFRMGEALGKLHAALARCGDAPGIWDNSLLGELTGWVREKLAASGFAPVDAAEFERVSRRLATADGGLPRQLIHRDVHCGNFLFDGETFSGYVDFDLSQRNIRVFDLCYFLLGLLLEDNGAFVPEDEWIAAVGEAARGYETAVRLEPAEKEAMPVVMQAIELLFAAFFMEPGGEGAAAESARLLRFVREREAAIAAAAGNA